tara:strand:+ start:6763 stop:8259 length:1497 start_codon:yes stop_codon:yes gene_type:complete
MTDNKSVLEQALLEAQQLEDAVKSNAKGILAATMKQEIEELVKESLTEQVDEDDFVEDDEEIEFADGEDFEDEEYEDLENEVSVSDLPDEEEAMVSIDMDTDEPLDLTAASDDEVLKVFKSMGTEDGIVVTQDGDMIDIEDQEAGTQYKIELAENKLRGFPKLINEGYPESDEQYEEVIEDGSDDIEMLENMEDYSDEPMYEIELGDEDEESDATFEELDEEGYNARLHQSIGSRDGKESNFIQSLLDRSDESKGEEEHLGHPRFSGNKHSRQEIPEGGMFKGDQGGHDYPHFHDTDPGYVDTRRGDGHGRQGGSDFTDEETNEASRTYGFGSKKGRGLRKAITNNRNLEFPMNESTKKHLNKVIRTAQQLQEENQAYREKNKEYRQALTLFREKLNEVAVFNANLAYSTKLFTESTTTKKEKINILRRFDNAQTLNESKILFKNIKQELSSKVNKLNESVQKTITKTPSGGSSINLIETKTYENPQITRMKDIMSKL